MYGQKRTWQQVKIKYKNILQTGKWLVCGEHRWHVCWHFIVCADFSNKKKSNISGTGDGPPTQDFTTAEELALDLNKGKPLIEGIQGGTATDSGPARDRYWPLHTRYIIAILLHMENIKIHIYFVMWTVWLCLTLQWLATPLHFWSHQTMIRRWVLFIKS